MGPLGDQEARPVLPVQYGKRPLSQSEVRADNARVVLGWARDEDTRTAFSKPKIGLGPFQRASALLEEIRRRSEPGERIPGTVWQAYDSESACDARLARKFFDSCLATVRRIRTREEWGPFSDKLLEPSTPEQAEAELRKLEERIEVATPGGPDEVALTASPVVVARRYTRDIVAAMRRSSEEMSSRISKGQKHKPGPHPVKVELGERLHIVAMKRAGRDVRTIAKARTLSRRVVERVLREERARLGEPDDERTGSDDTSGPNS